MVGDIDPARLTSPRSIEVRRESDMGYRHSGAELLVACEIYRGTEVLMLRLSIPDMRLTILGQSDSSMI